MMLKIKVGINGRVLLLAAETLKKFYNYGLGVIWHQCASCIPYGTFRLLQLQYMWRRGLVIATGNPYTWICINIYFFNGFETKTFIIFIYSNENEIRVAWRVFPALNQGFFNVDKNVLCWLFSLLSLKLYRKYSPNSAKRKMQNRVNAFRVVKEHATWVLFFMKTSVPPFMSPFRSSLLSKTLFCFTFSHLVRKYFSHLVSSGILI